MLKSIQLYNRSTLPRLTSQTQTQSLSLSGAHHVTKYQPSHYLLSSTRFYSNNNNNNNNKLQTSTQSQTQQQQFKRRKSFNLSSKAPSKTQQYKDFNRAHTLIHQYEAQGRFPTIEEAKAFPHSWHEMSNNELLPFCGPDGKEEANEERLIRDIMSKDNVEWHEALERFEVIRDFTQGKKTKLVVGVRETWERIKSGDVKKTLNDNTWERIKSGVVKKTLQNEGGDKESDKKDETVNGMKLNQSTSQSESKSESQQTTEIDLRPMAFQVWGLLPYRVGFCMFTSAAIASVPMVFHLDLVSWFNFHFVTTDVPEARDLETLFEVGSWSWNWMEPPLGTLSFVILCMQMARNQMLNLGIRPYANFLKKKRAALVVKQFPQYNAVFLSDYAYSASWGSWKS